LKSGNFNCRQPGVLIVADQPAKSTIESHFLLFYAHVPQGLTKVDSLELQNGQIAIEDRTAQKEDHSRRLARAAVKCYRGSEDCSC
jgi:hypothetical protein